MPFPLSVEQKQTAFWVVLWLAFGVLLVALGPVLTPFLAAAIIAYALNPGVDRIDHLRLGRFDVPRPLAVVVVVLLFFCAVLSLVLIVVPVLQTEIPLLQAQIPAFLAKANDVLSPRLREMGIKVQLDSAGIKKLVSQQMVTSGDEIWTAVLASARVGGTAVLGWIATVVLVPVLLFYLLLDWHQMIARIAGAVPRRYIGATVAMAEEVDTLLAQYLRGQLLVMVVLAVYYSTCLAIAGFDVALPVGILTGLLVFIPYLGFGLGLVLALIAAVLQFTDWSGVVAVAIIYGAGQVIEGFFLTPRLVGERIGLNPLAVIFALLAFGQLFGFVGVLLALPASAILMVAFKHLRSHYLRSSFYNA
ncbi:ABC transporter permease [Massilia sp. Root418]|jgi:predicted PurR-regulated permease PerM|uniref:AI-2E family transporter n=1 Tax=Massilia sp. Root418 TaxID=1736532 RepID=UPI0006F8C814|nr:AI-2E family transporter [Massilia sp. Root418]KQW89158.1 ABC transporter permease [Massilia sp. Root418]